MSLTINGSGGGIPLNVPKIESGSYTGTGTSGSTDPCSITFSGNPVYVIVSDTRDTSSYYGYIVFLPQTNLSSTYRSQAWARATVASGANIMTNAYAKLDGKTLSWYYSGGSNAAKAQMNDSGVTYNWVAFTL